jgi:glycosyltransferase involved in cell wall biosynthesis
LANEYNAASVTELGETVARSVRQDAVGAATRRFSSATKPLGGLRALQVVGGSKFGGAIHVIRHCSEVLRQAGVEVAIEASDPRVVEFFQSRGFQVHSGLPWAREISPVTDARYFLGLFRLLRRHRFDLVQTHTSKSNFVGRLAARAARVPIVVGHCHNLYYVREVSAASRAFYRLLEVLAGNFQDHAIFPDEELRDCAIRDGLIDSENATVIHNAVSWLHDSTDERERLRARESLGLRPGNLAVCLSGRLASGKGLDVLFAAWAQIAPCDSRLQLLVAGDGPERVNLERLAARLRIQDSVRFLGFREDVRELLAASDAFVMPSLWEGQPLSLLEAMAAGLPIAATNIKGIRGTVRNEIEAILVAPGDPAALARALKRVTSDPALRAKLGEAARKRAEVLFDPVSIGQQLRDLYCRLAQEKIADASSLRRQRGLPTHFEQKQATLVQTASEDGLRGSSDAD